MPRRSVLLLVIVVVAALAMWVTRATRPAERVVGEEPRVAEGVPAPEPATLAAPEWAPSSEEVAAEPSREEVALVREERTAVPEPSASTATLVARAIEKQTGAPLARVRVWARPARAGSHTSGYIDGTQGTMHAAPITDEEGAVEIEVPPGVDLQVSAEGEDGQVGQATRFVAGLDAGERREVVLGFATYADLHYFGRVLAREDRSPVAASIDVVRYETTFTSFGDEPLESGSTGSVLAETTTDANGLFELRIQSWRQPDVQVQSPGFATVLVQIGPDHDAPEKAKEILLSRAATLHARILDANGSGATDASVRLWTESYKLGQSDHGTVYLPSLNECEWSATTDATGMCRVEGLPPEVPLHVEVLREGKLAKVGLPDLSFHPGEERGIEWRIGSGCLLTGTVVDQDGQPMADRKLWLQRADLDALRSFQKYHSGERVREARTSSDARFSFPDVEPGTWWLGPAAIRDDDDAADPDALAAVGEVVEVLEGLPGLDIVLRVHRGLYIRGTVLTPSGELAPGTGVIGRGVGSWIDARTRDDGSFALGPLIPGRYSLLAHGGQDADSEALLANAGDRGVVLRLRAGGSLAGRVVDGKTGEARAARITCAPTSGGDFDVMMTESNEDGFRIEGLVPGTYDITASTGMRAGVLRGVSLDAGSETSDLVVTLVPAALVRVKYAGSVGYMNYSAIADGVACGGDGIAPGGISEVVVPSGRIVIRYRIPKAEPQEVELRLEVGEERELDLGGAR